ncbi:hypothetical protein E2F47_22240 [Mycobacterium eburneum]|nr:hypothetical protein E2F47_22240 [Mycobacterium eburneum]
MTSRVTLGGTYGNNAAPLGAVAPSDPPPDVAASAPEPTAAALAAAEAAAAAAAAAPAALVTSHPKAWPLLSDLFLDVALVVVRRAVVPAPQRRLTVHQVHRGVIRQRPRRRAHDDATRRRQRGVGRREDPPPRQRHVGDVDVALGGVLLHRAAIHHRQGRVAVDRVADAVIGRRVAVVDDGDGLAAEDHVTPSARCCGRCPATGTAAASGRA